MSMETDRKIKEPKYACEYVAMIECMPGERQCDKCGWNPDVAEQRKAAVHDRGARK